MGLIDLTAIWAAEQGKESPMLCAVGLLDITPVWAEELSQDEWKYIATREVYRVGRKKCRQPRKAGAMRFPCICDRLSGHKGPHIEYRPIRLTVWNA